MLMESRDVKHPLFMRLPVALQCPLCQHDWGQGWQGGGGGGGGGTASAAPCIRVGMSQVVWRSLPGPAMLCF